MAYPGYLGEDQKIEYLLRRQDVIVKVWIVAGLEPIKKPLQR